MNNKIKIAIAEDHQVFREAFIYSLETVSDIEVAFGCGNGIELFSELSTSSVDIVLLDLNMPLMDGRESLRILKQEYPSIKVIILSLYYSDEHVRKYMQLGAKGYLSKDFDYDTALEAIRDVYHQGYFFYDKVSRELVAEIIENQSLNLGGKRRTQLSRREREVIRLICQQKTNSEIAQLMNISIRTVQNHRLHISKKTGVRNAVGILIYALKHGIYDLEP